MSQKAQDSVVTSHKSKIRVHVWFKIRQTSIVRRPALLYHTNLNKFINRKKNPVLIAKFSINCLKMPLEKQVNFLEVVYGIEGTLDTKIVKSNKTILEQYPGA